jgi:hypothetical protein
MTRLYRIEIDVFLDDAMRTKVIKAARDRYQNVGGAWTEENGHKVRIPADEIVVDTKTAFIELAESAFCSALPGIEPHAVSCGIVKGATGVRTGR